jgi:uncharacterized protein YjbI with pentapeptide repeats
MEQDPKTLRERAEELIRLLVSDWRPTPQQVLWAIRIVIVFVLVLSILTLVGRPYDINLWQWLDLLIIPVVLAIGGYLFTRSENRATRVAAEQRAQDEALQSYLDQIGQLMLDKDKPLRQSKEGDEVRTLARARTLTVVAKLDGERKRSVVQFLYEAGLINKDGGIIALRAVDLREADLSGAVLSEANLSGANLREADLSGAVLSGARLSGANLSGANLSNAVLIGALLLESVLEGANLSETNLYEAKLTNHTTLNGANLKDAYLRDAYLAGAGLSRADLSGADLRGAYLAGATFEYAKLRDASLVQTYLGRKEGGPGDYDFMLGEQKAYFEMLTLLGTPIIPNDLEYEPGNYTQKLPNFSMADLTEADFTGATADTEVLEALREAEHLAGATIPNGQKYEDWLKSKDREEDGKNGGSP